MDKDQLIQVARDQLNRTLTFFPRVDAKASVILAIDASMLALLAYNAPPIRALEWYMVFATIPIMLIGFSLWQVYGEVIPRLGGGYESLIYFREIANRTETNYISEFIGQNEDGYLKDLLSQIWRNSEILRQKYDHVKLGFQLLAFAIIPWGITLAMFAAKNLESKALLVK